MKISEREPNKPELEPTIEDKLEELSLFDKIEQLETLNIIKVNEIAALLL